MQISYKLQFWDRREVFKSDESDNGTCNEMQIATWWIIANVHKSLQRFQLPCGMNVNNEGQKAKNSRN